MHRCLYKFLQPKAGSRFPPVLVSSGCLSLLRGGQGFPRRGSQRRWSLPGQGVLGRQPRRVKTPCCRRAFCFCSSPPSPPLINPRLSPSLLGTTALRQAPRRPRPVHRKGEILLQRRQHICVPSVESREKLVCPPLQGVQTLLHPPQPGSGPPPSPRPAYPRDSGAVSGRRVHRYCPMHSFLFWTLVHLRGLTGRSLRRRALSHTSSARASTKGHVGVAAQHADFAGGAA
jgi:hypothetical protein